MPENLKMYLWNEFKINNLPKFYQYFEIWIENLTESQLRYYLAYSEGKKTPWQIWHAFCSRWKKKS